MQPDQRTESSKRRPGAELELWLGGTAGVDSPGLRPGGETGRRLRLKISWGQPRPGSNPGPGMRVSAYDVSRVS
jgi:hypothetical protein